MGLYPSICALGVVLHLRHVFSVAVTSVTVLISPTENILVVLRGKLDNSF